MKILIVEDENLAAKRLIALVKEQLPEAQIFGNIDTITASVKWLQNNPEPDLIFLDIQLADGISFEIFDKVKVSAPIIFCTAYDHYAIKAFKLNSIDYLLKPIDPDELKQAIFKFEAGKREPVISMDQIKNLLHQAQQTYKSRFLVKQGERIQTIDTQDVSFFLSEDKVTLLQNRQGKRFIIDYTLDEVQNMLNPESFFRISRKYIVSVSAIKEVFSYSNSRLKIHLENCSDNDILVSREKTGHFKSWLGQ
jgi:DNA-binding LytR/AlgR family response regulator